ncbi:MAG: hypothetical protein GX280_08310 [Lentisphaerae bacterium]|nr:hypothetical protein [Victivallaceae bacterium]MDD5664091.1 hypothetical protein [Victivallaceae bacterium]NLK84061.1 hypothetical protein [Lentisphaerota bacterium]
MKWLNIVLSVFVLLLAIASATCSYFLFEKRELLVKGWGKMAVSLNNAAKDFDKSSGTETAKMLSTEEISHENYDKLDSNLSKFNDQVRKIVKQRDDLSSAVRNTAGIMEMSNIPEQSSFTALDSYERSVPSVIEHISTVKKRYDDTIDQICATGKQIDAPLDAGALKGSRYRTEYTKLSNRISAMDSKIKSYDAGYRRLAGLTNVKLANSDFEYSAINATTNKLQAGITTIKNDLKTAQSLVGQKDLAIAEIQKTVDLKDKQIAAERIAARKLKEHNNTLLQLLEKEGIPRDIKLWEDGSKDVRRALQGKVIEVDEHFGFIVIDIGSATKVGQQLGPKIAYFSPRITDNAEFMVVRDLDKDDSRYIGRVKLFKLSENNSYAKQIAPAVKAEKIRVGDFVFLPDDAIEAMSSAKTEPAVAK